MVVDVVLKKVAAPKSKCGRLPRVMYMVALSFSLGNSSKLCSVTWPAHSRDSGGVIVAERRFLCGI